MDDRDDKDDRDEGHGRRHSEERDGVSTRGQYRCREPIEHPHAMSSLLEALRYTILISTKRRSNPS